MRPAPIALAAALAASFTLAGCQSMENATSRAASFFVYRMDINQGNFLTQDMVDRLKVGQTKQQVRTILGTPLVESPFHADRWDYPYLFRRDGRLVDKRQFTVFFVDGKLARWEGDEMPPSVADLNRAAAERAMRPGPQPDDPGLMGWIMNLFRW